MSESRSEFEAWVLREHPDVGVEGSPDYYHSRTQDWWIGWQASRQAALESAEKACDEVYAEMTGEAGSKFLTDAGRDAYTSASMGAKSCAAAIRSLAQTKEAP